MASDEIIRAVHKATGVIETGPRGYFEDAFPHLYREATEKDLKVARGEKAAPAAAPAPTEEEGN